MPRTHGANRSILFAQILDPYEVTRDEFAQIKDVLFAHVCKPIGLSTFQLTKLEPNYLLVRSSHSKSHSQGQMESNFISPLGRPIHNERHKKHGVGESCFFQPALI